MVKDCYIMMLNPDERISSR